MPASDSKRVDIIAEGEEGEARRRGGETEERDIFGNTTLL